MRVLRQGQQEKLQKPLALLCVVGLLWVMRFRSLCEIAARFAGQLDRLHHCVSCSRPRARDLTSSASKVAFSAGEVGPARSAGVVFARGQSFRLSDLRSS